MREEKSDRKLKYHLRCPQARKCINLPTLSSLRINKLIPNPYHTVYGFSELKY
jgi:hypothetical protein